MTALAKALMLLCIAWFMLSLGSCYNDLQADDQAALSRPASERSAQVNSSGLPNFLIIIADDLAYSDIGAFGGEIRTPNLDRLARSGQMLTNFYAAPTCSPTRAMLLSGRDNHEVGLGTMDNTIPPGLRGVPGYEGYLSRDVVTLASMLQERGYQTMMAGKWHLGMDEHHSPASFGFQRSFALLQGASNHFGADQGAAYAEIGHAAKYRRDGKIAMYPEGRYTADYFTEEILEYLAQRKPGQPFFAYLAFTEPHWPLQAPLDDIERYRGRYADGPSALRARRLARLQELGLAQSSISVRSYDFPDWERMDVGARALEARKMEVYAAMVDRMDRNIGRVLKLLDEDGAMDDTIIVFMSDNSPDPLSLTAPFSLNDDGSFRASNGAGGVLIDNSLENLGAATSFVSYGPDWAQAGAAPSAGAKGSTLEGGVRTPAIVSGPGVARGCVSNEVAHVLDILPTLLAYAGVAEASGELAGRSWAPLLAQCGAFAWGDERALNWELFGRRAARKGRWKAVNTATYIAALRHGTAPMVEWELYDLASDPGESQDLADEHPEILNALIAQWEAYGEHVGVVFPPEMEHEMQRPSEE